MKITITELWINGVLVAQAAQTADEFDINDVLVIVKETEHRKEDKVIAIK